MIEPGAKNFFIRLSWLIILLGGLTLMFQVWGLSARELSQNEGFFAAVASEINPALPMTTAHGVGIKNRFFLYPLLCSILEKHTPLQLIDIMRYINFFFMAATAVLLAFTAGFTRDFKAGVISCAFFCANIFVLFCSLYASPLMMSLFFLFAAQSAWIYFGFTKGQWNRAWIYSLLLISLGFLSGGVKIVLYFFLPMFFLHRPLKLSSKINKKGFIAGMILLGCAFLCWALPFLLYSRGLQWDYIDTGYRGMSNFLLNILKAPFELLLTMIPWTLIIWIPFCVAIRPLDRTPIFSHYFRVIFITDFICILFNPLSTMEDFIFTLPPLVLLTAITYDTAVRRYSVEIRRMAILCGYISVFLAALLMLYCFLPHETLQNYTSWLPLTEGKEPIFGTIIAFFGLAVWNYHYRKKGQVWMLLFLTACAIGIFCQHTFIPVRNADRSRTELGENIYQAIKNDGNPQAVIYKIGILDLYSESYYMRKNVRKINTLSNIDKKSQVVYLLTTNFPEYPERTWKNLFETTYRGQKLYLYRGETVKRKELINRRNLQLENGGVK